MLGTIITSLFHHFSFTDSNTLNNIGFYRVVIEATDEYDDDGYDSNVDIISNNTNTNSNIYISPSSAHAGENITLTITLNNDDFGRSVPPLQSNQGVSIPINSLIIESIESSNIFNISRISRFIITCNVSVPNSIPSDIVDVTISFLGPNGNTPTFLINDGFIIE